MRQIPYISSDWKNKEVEKFVYHCKEINIESRGRLIAKEGAICDKVYIVAEGEVEVVKTDLNAIFMNYQAGVIGMKEQNKGQKLLRSNNFSDIIDEESKVALKGGNQLEGPINYTNSDFALSV